MAKKEVKNTTADSVRSKRSELTGEVVSDKMDKTISVRVYHTVRHAKYGKFISKSSTFKAHDEKEVAKMGDLVSIHETRPLSKTKRWTLVKVLVASKQTEGVEV
jgi:small subunit ribosomal protein S17